MAVGVGAVPLRGVVRRLPRERLDLLPAREQVEEGLDVAQLVSDAREEARTEEAEGREARTGVHVTY